MELTTVGRGVLWLGVCASLAACDPCGDLDQRICAELGPEECALWQSGELPIRTAILDENEHRSRTRANTCSVFNDDATFAQRTMPMVRNDILRHRDPQAAITPIAHGPVPGSSTGYLWYLLTPVMLILFGGYSVYRYRYTMAQHRSGQSAAQDAQARAMAEMNAQRTEGEGPGPVSPE